MCLRRRGFSIVEVLVTLGVLSMLMGFLLPAVHRTREAARRTQCRNNLKQLGIALHNYDSIHRAFPPGSVPAAWSFKAMLLPQLGDAVGFSQIDFSNNIDPLSGWYSCGPESLRLAQVSVEPDRVSRPVFYCPSDPSAGSGLPGWRKGNYLGVSGDGVGDVTTAWEHRPGVPLPPARKGTLFFCSHVSVADLHDGTSSTIVVGERGVQGYAADLCAGFGTSERFSWLATGGGLRECIRGNPENDLHFWSHHSHGTHFLFGDGHVGFLSNSISNEIYWSLSTRAASETIAEF